VKDGNDEQFIFVKTLNLLNIIYFWYMKWKKEFDKFLILVFFFFLDLENFEKFDKNDTDSNKKNINLPSSLHKINKSTIIIKLKKKHCIEYDKIAYYKKIRIIVIIVIILNRNSK